MAKSFDDLVDRTTSKKTRHRAALRTRELLGELLLSEVRKLVGKSQFQLAEALGIKQPPMIGLASAAGSTMQVDGGNAAFAANALDMDIVTVADRQQFRRQRREWIGPPHARIRRHLGLPSPACRLRNCDR